MRLVASMDGKKCDKAHTLYMEGMAAMVIHVLRLSVDIGLFRLCILLFFSRVVVLFSTRVFLIGNPYLILKEGVVIWADFPHFIILAKLPPSARMKFLF